MDGDVTALLRAWGSGDESVSDELFQAVYSQLRSLARHHLRARSGITLTPTVLIHEAFLELAADPIDDWRDRVQFFAFTATRSRPSRISGIGGRRSNSEMAGHDSECSTQRSRRNSSSIERCLERFGR